MVKSRKNSWYFRFSEADKNIKPDLEGGGQLDFVKMLTGVTYWLAEQRLWIRI